jgi:hypothetical protein
MQSEKERGREIERGDRERGGPIRDPAHTSHMSHPHLFFAIYQVSVPAVNCWRSMSYVSHAIVSGIFLKLSGTHEETGPIFGKYSKIWATNLEHCIGQICIMNPIHLFIFHLPVNDGFKTLFPPQSKTVRHCYCSEMRDALIEGKKEGKRERGRERKIQVVISFPLKLFLILIRFISISHSHRSLSSSS